MFYICKNVEIKWEKIKRDIQEAAKQMLGFSKKATSVEWLTAEMIILVEERRKLKRK